MNGLIQLLRIHIKHSRMRYNLSLFAFFLLFVLYSCSGGYIKYPSYNVKPNPIQHKYTAKKHNVTIKNRSNRGIDYLKKGMCKKAISYFKNKGNNFYASYWLSISYGYCGNADIAIRKLQKIENRSPNGVWSSRIYASLALFLKITHKKYMDYAQIAYAYDSRNVLSKRLISHRDTNIKQLFYIIFSWR